VSCDRRRCYDLGRIVLANRLQRRQHGRASRQPVVDQDHCPARQLRRWPVAAVDALAALELAPLLRVDRFNPFCGQIQSLDQLGVEHTHASRRDRSKRELLMTGYPQLANQVDVKRQIQLASHLVGHGNAAARQPQDDHIVAAGILAQTLGQTPPRFAPVAEAPDLCDGLSVAHRRSAAQRPSGRSGSLVEARHSARSRVGTDCVYPSCGRHNVNRRPVGALAC
jgi:hypothetical protein